MKSLFLTTALVVATAGPLLADCSNLNSSELLENTPWDQVFTCLEQAPEIIKKVDANGYNLLMTAVTSDIHPMELDDILYLIPEDLKQDVTNATDLQGRSLGHIAASEASDPAFIFVLSSHAISLAEQIDSAIDPNTAGQTPLHFAAQREDGWPFVAALMANGATNIQDDQQRNAFDVALDREVIGADALLLSDGNWPTLYAELFEPVQSAVDAQCDNLLTQQFFATAKEEDVAACLVDENQIIAVDQNGNSILHFAAENSEDPWIIDLILSSTDSPKTLLDKRNSAGKTSLHLTADRGKSEQVLLHLLAWGADPNALFNPEKKKFGLGKRGVSALHMAVSRKDDLRAPMISVLLAFGADTMLQDTSGKSTTSGRTALHRALMEPDPVTLIMLLESQSKKENRVAKQYRKLFKKSVKQISDDAGRTVLHMAASRQSDFDTLFLLTKYGFSVDQKDNDGFTPLMFAAQNFKDADNFLFMLENSEKPCGASKTGVTVEAALRTNAELMAIGVDDTSGKTLSPLALLKQRCP